MPKGLPTLIAMLLLAGTLAFWGWKVSDSAPSTGPATTHSVPAGGWGSVRVMTANIRIADPTDGENAWPNRRDFVAKTFLKYQPDIIACQEVTPAQGVFLNKELASWYSYFPRAGIGTVSNPTPRATNASSTSSPGGAGGGSSGAASEILGVLSQSLASLNTIYYRTERFDALDGEAGLILPDQPQPDPTENAFYSMVLLREHAADGRTPRTFIIADLHLRHVQSFAVQCAMRVREKLAAWQKKWPAAGVIVTGDMNHSREERTYAALVAGLALPEGAVVDPATLNTSHDGHPLLGEAFNYAAKPADVAWGNWHNFTGKVVSAWPTDLILFTGGLSVAQDPNGNPNGYARLIQDQNESGHYPSDHYFVIADLDKK